jgi:protein-S-isoprenylcysteine O-methyltransferase Ste14
MLLFAVLMWMLSQYYPLLDWTFNTQYMGLGLMFIGGCIDFSSLVNFLFSKTSVNPMKPEKTQVLVTSGMYRFSRNPMYLGLLLLLTGWALYVGALSALLLLPLFVLTITKMQIQPEELVLEELFGQSYLEYKSTVRRWI